MTSAALLVSSNHGQNGVPAVGLTSFEDPVSVHMEADSNLNEDLNSATTSPSSPSSSTTNAAAIVLNDSANGSLGVVGLTICSPHQHHALRLNSEVFSPKAVSSYHTLLNMLEKQRDVSSLAGLCDPSASNSANSNPSSLSSTPGPTFQECLDISPQQYQRSLFKGKTGLTAVGMDFTGGEKFSIIDRRQGAESCILLKPSSINSETPVSPLRSASNPCFMTTSSGFPSRAGSSLNNKRRKSIPIRSPRSRFDSTDIPGIVFTFQSSPLLKVLHLPMDYTNYVNNPSLSAMGLHQMQLQASCQMPAVSDGNNYSSENQNLVNSNQSRQHQYFHHHHHPSSSNISNSNILPPDHAGSDGSFSDDDYDGTYHKGTNNERLGRVITYTSSGRASRATSSSVTSSSNGKDSHSRRPSSKKPPLNARVCASCGVSKTPYWREAWDAYIVLCNACGLRYSKFKKRCIKCSYVPRKDDKGGRCCPVCSGEWA